MKLLRRLYLIDISRGLASFAVVIWHYQHFYFEHQTLGPIDRSALPFYRFLKLFFDHGLHGVEFFFVISGFVFFYQYLDQIRHQQISARIFFIRRFSRLYPLHFVTLITVAVGQHLARVWSGGYFVYPYNDLRHFILNLLMASSWGAQRGFSFNGPVWSVSTEVLLYIFFFYFAAHFSRFKYSVPAVILLSFFIWNSSTRVLSITGLALCCFFTGGAAALLYQKYRSHPKTNQWKNFTVSLCFLGAAAVLYHFALLSPLEKPKAIALYLFIFPSILYMLASLQDIDERYGFSFRMIGDITYATYMIHFPLQLFIVITAAKTNRTLNYYHPTVFLLYLLLLIGLAIPTYYFFEKPAQNYFRRKLDA